MTRFAAIETLRASLPPDTDPHDVDYTNEYAALAALQQLAEAADRVSPVALKHWTESESDALEAAVARVKGNQA